MVTLTVIDIGCASHGGDQSVQPLLDRFQPDRFIGYDPFMSEGQETLNGTCRVSLLRRAAWTTDGSVEFAMAGLGSHVETGSGRYVRCDNLVRVVREAAVEGDVVLKMDAEMSEYTLLPRLIEEGLDQKIGLLLIEWHCPWCLHGEWSHSAMCGRGDQENAGRVTIEQAWRGEIEEWTR